MSVLPRDSTERQHGYGRWRASLPWSDDDICAALELYASDCRRRWGDSDCIDRRLAFNKQGVRMGRLSRFILGKALPYLVKSCHVCGKTALYRRGNHGACRLHRDTLPSQPQRYEQRSALVERAQRLKERGMKRSDERHKYESRSRVRRAKDRRG